MRFAYGIPLTHPVDAGIAAAVPELAATAEGAGFDAFFVTEHPAPSQRWLERGGHDTLDPFVALAAASTATRTIRLLTNLTVVPYRNPFLLAKASATLDVLSGGRLILGAGVGYLKSEYAALGVDYDTRNARFDEYIDVLFRAWSGEPVDYEGAFVNARGIVSHPPPAQQPRPPVWLGGNSPLSRRRVLRFAQGWMPLPDPASASGTPSDVVAGFVPLLEDLRVGAEEAGRSEPVDVLFVLPPGGTAENAVELVERLTAVGVTWLAVNGAGTGPAEAKEYIERFGVEVIARTRG